jgi:arginine deiminase
MEVHGEYDPLLRALVQPPGVGMARVLPDELHRHGFMDLTDLPGARREHRLLRAVLQDLGVELLCFDRMLLELLRQLDSREREALLGRILALNPQCPPALRRRLADMSPERLTLTLLHGVPAQGSLQQAVEGVRFFLRPLVNVSFLKDVAMVVGRRVVSGVMASPLRAAEQLLMEELILRHPAFGSWGEGVFWIPPSLRMSMGGSERAEEAAFLSVRRARLRGHRGEDPICWEAEGLRLEAAEVLLRAGPPLVVEGGDLLLLRGGTRRCLVAGVGHRTTARSVDLLADRILRRSSDDDGVDAVLAVVLPEREDVRSLDTVLAAPHPEHLVAYGPVLLDAGRDTARFYTLEFEGRRPRATARRSLPDALRAALGEDAPDVLAMPQAAADAIERVAAEHAQWSGALNLLTVRPGVVVVFERAEALLDTLARERGYAVVSHEDLPEDFQGPTAITVPGGELSRAGGGPRSLVLPLVRRPGGPRAGV